MTNALKALIAQAVGAALGLAVLFGVELSPDQIAGILVLANSLLAIWIYLTRGESPARDPDYEGRG